MDPKLDRKILVVDDEPDITTLLENRLRQAGYSVFTAKSGEEALYKVKEFQPDLILLDVMMPDKNGFEVKQDLNKSESTADIPVVFLTAKTGEEDKIKGFDLQAHDYVTKPFIFRELLARMEAILLRRDRQDEQLMTDSMTGLHNHHGFKHKLKWLFDIAKRYKRDFTLVVVDIDDLKKVNDTHGHAAGDDLIRRTAEAMKKVFRTSDILIRYGGDEFVVIMPETVEIQAAMPVDRMRIEINKQAPGKIPFTISVGAAGFKQEMKDEMELFALADERMYHEKELKKSGAKPANR